MGGIISTRYGPGSIYQQMQILLNAVAILDSGVEVTELATLMGLISAGFGVSIVGEQALPLCKRPGLAAVPIIDPTAVRPIYMVKRRHRSLSTAATEMWERLFQASPR